MSDLWIIYNAGFDNKESSANRMLAEAKAQNISSELLFSDYFSFTSEILYKNEIITDLPKIAFYRGRDEAFIQKLEAKGIRVINNSYATINCKDKYKTHQIAGRLGINQPLTYLLENKSYEYYHTLFNGKFLLKNRYGAQGKDIYLIDNEAEYKKITSEIVIDDYIIQQFVSVSSGRDVRAYIIGGRVIGSMERRNDNSYLANVAQGGLSYHYEIDDKTKESALLLAKELKGDIISVDYLFSNNGLTFCEANTNAGFASFIFLGYDIRKEMMSYIKSLLMNK